MQPPPKGPPTSLIPHSSRPTSSHTHTRSPAIGNQYPSALARPDEVHLPSRRTIHETSWWHDQDLKTMLFSTLTLPVLTASAPTPPQPTCRRTTRCVNLRRSAHLAAKRRSGSVMHRAQEALAHKLGTLPKDQPLMDDVLIEYLATFEAPIAVVQDGLLVHFASRRHSC